MISFNTPTSASPLRSPSDHVLILRSDIVIKLCSALCRPIGQGDPTYVLAVYKQTCPIMKTMHVTVGSGQDTCLRRCVLGGSLSTADVTSHTLCGGVAK